jgi:hypothetical protein
VVLGDVHIRAIVRRIQTLCVWMLGNAGSLWFESSRRDAARVHRTRVEKNARPPRGVV